MKERPILFSAPMVLALLAGRKTQTRRTVGEKDAARLNSAFFYADPAVWKKLSADPAGFLGLECPHGAAGDHLWVRETWAPAPPIAPLLQHHGASPRPEVKALYRANPHQAELGVVWKPSIHMPRWASRLALEVVSVRVERLQEISGSHAIAEGIEPTPSGLWRDYERNSPVLSTSGPVSSYRSLWESLNGAGSWKLNPWVWVIEFKKLDGARA